MGEEENRRKEKRNKGKGKKIDKIRRQTTVNHVITITVSFRKPSFHKNRFSLITCA
jgi:hypothetical protein